MRYLFIIISIMLTLLVVGCISTPGTPQPYAPLAPEKNRTCKTVSEEVPLIKEECGNVSYTEEVCSLRKLNYTVIAPPKIDLCIGDGACVGKPLGECQGCSKAMTRCVLIIHNDEPQKSGVWSVGANYTLGNAGFHKDPITQTIGPNQSYTFDFSQIYAPGQPINSASCVVGVVSEPIIEECHQETRSRQECRNVTITNTVQREVCE